MSERVSTSSWLRPACSGLMYSTVPTTAPRPEAGVQRLLGQLRAGRLDHAEVDDLGHRLAVVQRDQDVGGLDVAVNDALLVGVLDGLEHRHEQLQALPRRQAVFVAILG